MVSKTSTPWPEVPHRKAPPTGPGPSAAAQPEGHPMNRTPVSGVRTPRARRKPKRDSDRHHPPRNMAATAETWLARLLRALAQNPEPLSAPALASLLAEPGRRRGLLSAYDRVLRRHEQAGHVERTGQERKGRGRPAITWRITTAGRGWLDDHDRHQPSPWPPPHKHGAQPPNGTRRWTKPAPPSASRPRGSAANAPLTSSENSAAPSARSARYSTSAKRGSARISSGTRRPYSRKADSGTEGPTPAPLR